VESPGRHFGSLVVERSNQGRHRLFVDQAIKEVDTEPPHDGLLMPKPTLDGRESGRT
jgi:hypothetical protein